MKTKWNRYEIVDGLNEITEVRESEHKPEGKGWHKKPSVKIDWSTVDPNPALAFPVGHGIGHADNANGGVSK